MTYVVTIYCTKVKNDGSGENIFDWENSLKIIQRHVTQSRPITFRICIGNNMNWVIKLFCNKIIQNSSSSTQLLLSTFVDWTGLCNLTKYRIICLQHICNIECALFVRNIQIKSK